MTADEFAAELRGRAASTPDYTPVFDAVRLLIHASTERHFASQSTPDGAAWPKRKPTPNDDGHALLQESGALFRAATGRGQGSVDRVDDGAELVLGVDKGVRLGGIPGAAVHQWGYQPRNIPPREWQGLTEEEIDTLAEVTASILEGAVA